MTGLTLVRPVGSEPRDALFSGHHAVATVVLAGLALCRLCFIAVGKHCLCDHAWALALRKESIQATKKAVYRGWVCSILLAQLRFSVVFPFALPRSRHNR